MKADKSRIAKYAIGGAVVAGLAAYIVITAIPKDPKALPDTSRQEQSGTSSQAGYTPDDPYVSDPYYDPDISSGDSEPEFMTNGEIPGLRDGSGKKVCYVYEAPGFMIKEGPAYVTIRPEDMDIAVTGNRELTLHWGNVSFFADLKSDGVVDDLKTGHHEVIDEFEYRAGDDGTARVYVIAVTKAVAIAPDHDDAEDESADPADPADIRYADETNYTIAIDVPHNGLYPIISIFDDDIVNYISARYPDVPSLARAWLKPVEIF